MAIYLEGVSVWGELTLSGAATDADVRGWLAGVFADRRTNPPKLWRADRSLQRNLIGSLR